MPTATYTVNAKLPPEKARKSPYRAWPTCVIFSPVRDRGSKVGFGPRPPYPIP